MYQYRDHLGNVRLSYSDTNKNDKIDVGEIIEETNYYPFGLAHQGYNEKNNTIAQNYKYQYNGKENQDELGLNLYDYGARNYDAAIGRWMSVDPLAEQTPNWTPYRYGFNNPIRYIDPTGMFEDDIYYNEQGKEIYRTINNDPDRNFVIKTTQTADQMYGTGSSPQKGTTQPITTTAAVMTESEISSGNLTGEHMKNVVEIKNTDSMKAMLGSIKDDGLGGTSLANNREYSGSFGKNGVYNTKESKANKPTDGKQLVTIGENDYHSHPSGTEDFTINGESYVARWKQPPSKQDITVAGSRIQYVPAMRNQTIYIYNNKGVIATIPISTFK